MTQQLLSQHSNRPQEGDEVTWWRAWLTKIIYGLYYQKAETLREMGFPPRPVSQKEIFREVTRRTEMLKDEELWGRCTDYPHRFVHNHNWIERRVNELATEEYGLKTRTGILKVVCVDKRRGMYQPNPTLFEVTQC